MPLLDRSPMDGQELQAFMATAIPLLLSAKYDRERAVRLAYDLAVDTCAEIMIRGGEEGFTAAVQTAAARRGRASADPARSP